MTHACDNDDCENTSVSDAYYRVFSQNDGTLTGCIECGNTYGQHGREI